MDEKILVLHVKKGYEDRGRHMEQMLTKRGLSFTYVLDGDIPDLVGDDVKRLFSGPDMGRMGAQTSCGMKHLLAYRYILDHQLKGALILEDDMLLFKNFEKVFATCMRELEVRKLKNAILSFEDSSLRFVPRSERRRGQHLYAHDRDRYAGAYYCTREAAQLILDYVEEHTCHIPIDLFHAYLIEHTDLNYYWCHPCIATQGTQTGLFGSSTSERDRKKQKHKRRTWRMRLAYKKFVTLFR